MKPYYEDTKAGIVIYHGDCREVLPQLEADVIVSDPPYGMAFVNNGSRKGWDAPHAGVAIAGDDDTSVRDSVLGAWAPRPALIFGTWKQPRPYGIREVLIWDKVVSTGMGDLSIPWRPSWEEIYVIGEGFVGSRSHGVLRFSYPTLAPERHFHPTSKPVELMRELIGKCPPGTILDPFMGSGTTLRAAKDLGRKAIGIEIEERYCEIAVKRLSQEVLAL